MRFLRRVRAMARVMPTARRNQGELPRWLLRRPQLLVATATGELGLLASNKLDLRLKQLAEMKAAAVTACEFCLDIGAALGRADGLTEAEILELHRFEESDAFDELDRLVLRFAEALSSTPAVVDPALREELLDRLGHAAFTELAFTVAWESKRGRFYLGLGISPAGFSDGLECAVPNRGPAATPS
jgi:AhpD family alkylhydroperoxidase